MFVPSSPAQIVKILTLYTAGDEEDIPVNLIKKLQQHISEHNIEGQFDVIIFIQLKIASIRFIKSNKFNYFFRSQKFIIVAQHQVHIPFDHSLQTMQCQAAKHWIATDST